MFRLVVSLIGFIPTAAMHPAIADPASAAPPATAHYAPAREQPAQVQVPVSETDAPFGAGRGQRNADLWQRPKHCCWHCSSEILLDDPAQKHANEIVKPSAFKPGFYQTCVRQSLLGGDGDDAAEPRGGRLPGQATSHSNVIIQPNRTVL